MPEFALEEIIDRLGIETGTVSLIYGRPRVGKTALGLGIVNDFIRKTKRALVVYSRPRFPAERLAKILTHEQMSSVYVSIPQTLLEQTLTLASIEFLTGQPSLIVVDEITDLYSLLLSIKGLSMNVVREAALEVNKQLGLISDYVRSHDAAALVISEERQGEFPIPLQRILLYWSENAFNMSVDLRGTPMIRSTKPDESLNFRCNTVDGFVSGLEKLK